MELNPPLMGWSHEGLMHSLCQLKQDDEMFETKFKNCFHSIPKVERSSLNVLIFVLNKTSIVNEKMNVKLLRIKKSVKIWVNVFLWVYVVSKRHQPWMT
jgi:uncharacterized protein (DUF2132 family)